jgi:hypothetical protein
LIYLYRSLSSAAASGLNQLMIVMRVAGNGRRKIFVLIIVLIFVCFITSLCC